MEIRHGFTHLRLEEFEGWLNQQNVARTIISIQEHHTAVPNYSHFNFQDVALPDRKAPNHFELQLGMKNYHVHHNGWVDIGQHFTIFPDGSIMTGRSLESHPACIFGANGNAICIENLGYFDHNADIMRQEQRAAIIKVTAALCKRFRVPVNTDRIVYHHWFDLSTGERTNGSGTTKTCPGTAFFGGNKVADAQENFIPQVQKAAGGQIDPRLDGLKYYASVTADALNIRNKPSASGTRLGSTLFSAVLRVYEERNGWLRISAGKQEWVSGRYTMRVERAVVTTNDLNIRSGPGTEFKPPLGNIDKGQVVFVYEQKTDWVKISPDSRWVSRKFVDFV